MKRLSLKILVTTILVTLLISGCSENFQQAQDNKLELTEKAQNTVSAASELSDAHKENGLGKVLIVYYSFTGSTKKVANTIKDITGGDIFEIQPEFNYNRADIEEIAKEQVQKGFEPDLKKADLKVEPYDTVFVGSPIWWFSPAPPVMSFLSKYNISDKKVVPFCTYKSDYGDFFSKFKVKCQSTKLLEGKDFRAGELDDEKKLRSDIEDWIKNLEK